MIKQPNTCVIRFPDDEKNELVFVIDGKCTVYSISEEQLYYLVAVGAQRLWCLRQVNALDGAQDVMPQVSGD